MLRKIHRMQLRDQRGFTLIELLIVIAIIAILAAIAVPQFAQYKKNAAAASGAGAIASCASELAAANAITTATTTRTCQLPGGGTCTVTINADTGVLGGCDTPTVSGYALTCTWTNNSVSCRAN